MRFLLALGQIMTRIRPDAMYYYGLAFPASYRPLVQRRLNPGLLKRLRLQLFFVNEKRQVEHVTWRELGRNGSRSQFSTN